MMSVEALSHDTHVICLEIYDEIAKKRWIRSGIHSVPIGSLHELLLGTQPKILVRGPVNMVLMEDSKMILD